MEPLMHCQAKVLVQRLTLSVDGKVFSVPLPLRAIASSSAKALWHALDISLLVSFLANVMSTVLPADVDDRSRPSNTRC